MRGSRDWHSLASYAPIALSGKFFRLDVQFEDTEPLLDDVSSIPSIISSNVGSPEVLTVVKNIAGCARASLFYFELDSIPKVVDDTFIGSGSIFCGLSKLDDAYTALLRRIENASFLLNGARILTPAMRNADGKYQLQICLKVRDRFTIQLQENGSGAYHISGSPFSVLKLENMQELHSYFGRSDHGKRKQAIDSFLPIKRCRLF
jgi:hypothetical protein